MRTLSIDVGTRTTGWAYFVDDELKYFGFIKPRDFRNDASCDAEVAFLRAQDVFDALCDYKVDEVILEQPHHHRNTPNHENIRVLVQFTQALYTLFYLDAANGAKVHAYLPSEWKGTVPKQVTQRRVQEFLTESQQKTIDSYSKNVQHDVYDAIGIGKFRIKERTKWTKHKSKS